LIVVFTRSLLLCATLTGGRSANLTVSSTGYAEEYATVVSSKILTDVVGDICLYKKYFSGAIELTSWVVCIL
jgi:hypothetical protein